MRVYHFLFLIIFFVKMNSFAQNKGADVNGKVLDSKDKSELPFVSVAVFLLPDSTFVQGTISDGTGSFLLEKVPQGNYFLQLNYLGYTSLDIPFRVGRLNPYLDLGNIFMAESGITFDEVEIVGRRDAISGKMDKKSFDIDQNLSQLGGSVLQAMANLPGITVEREGQVKLRGSDQVTVLIDGKQNALTGFGQQQALDNIPASAIERIEIITNPSSKFDASGNAGIINIIFKKEKKQGWNGKVGLTGGAGALGEKRANLPGIRDQYRFTPKINPSASINYKQEKVNFFVMGDLLLHQQMMRNEFFDRTFQDGQRVEQQFLENRTQPIYNFKTGVDWNVHPDHLLTFSGLFNYRAYTDLGDIPYFNNGATMRNRLWQYYENEVNQTLLASLTHRWQFKQAGHFLESNAYYSFRRKDEVFFFDNFTDTGLGTDTTALIADENVFDLSIDYTKPFKQSRLELGTKQRLRIFPNLITFTPGINSILDPGLAGTAEYQERLSAIYGNYVWEANQWEIEAGLRAEYAKIDYLVDPNHTVYTSSGFDYLELFPSVRITHVLTNKSQLSVFYNRRVDRPEEKNLRVFPSYADPEILRIGNPALLPQFTQSFEAAFKQNFDKGYLYGAIYYRIKSNILTTILTSFPGQTRLASIDQNAGQGTNRGIELTYSTSLTKSLKLDLNSNVYENQLDTFTITNLYPSNIPFSMQAQRQWTGNVKANIQYKISKTAQIQATFTYLARDIVPQGTIDARYAIDFGFKQSIQKGKGELFANASDLFNTMVIRYQIMGNDFSMESIDYLETQAIRVGYTYRF